MTFDPLASGYEPENALTFAKMSSFAYQTYEELAPRGSSFATARFFEAGGTTALLLAGDAAVAVAFRGTETDSLADWVSDARIRLVRFAGGEVHCGFREALGDVLDDLGAELDRHPGKPLWITGHSLGGALAVLLAARALADGRAVGGLYTYGQPRVGDAEFAASWGPPLAGRYFRFVNGNDPVPRVPPVLLGYRGFGCKLCFGPDGRLGPAGDFTDEVAAVWAILRAGDEASSLQGITAHAIAGYVAGLERNLDFRPPPEGAA